MDRRRATLGAAAIGCLLLVPLMYFLGAFAKTGTAEGAWLYLMSGRFLSQAHPIHLWFLEYLLLLYAVLPIFALGIAQTRLTRIAAMAGVVLVVPFIATVAAALVFPSGFITNLGLVTALAGAEDVIFSDALNHASLIDGCRLSRASVHVYRHADANHLADLLLIGAREAVHGISAREDDKT